MNDPIRHAQYVLAALPAEPSELSAEHLPKISAAVGVSVRFGDEIRGRQQRLAATIAAGDRSPSAAKRLKKIGKQMDRLFKAEALLKPFVDRALELEAAGPAC